MARSHAIGVVCALFGLLVLAPGCAAEDGEDVASESDALATENGAGAGKAWFDVDPCDAPQAFAKKHGYHLIEMKPDQHKMHGTGGKDLIVGTNGDDVIFGGGGDDIVCAGYGEDKVHGEAGKDYIDGGGDNDELWGDEGNDLIHGRGGSDDIHGGQGDDLLFGDILDDKIWGDAGDDLLIGGHGTDVLDGGPGNDYLRGDTGNDGFFGGAGKDVVSFVTAMPPGQGETVGGPKKISGVHVDFTDRCEKAGLDYGPKQHDGCANGDGGNEPMDDVEVVIGSPYEDKFEAGNKGVRFVAGRTERPAGTADHVYAVLDTKARDTGLVIVGTGAFDSIDVVREQGDKIRVKGIYGTKVLAGDDCKQDGDDAVCDPSHELRWIAAWMGDGDDRVQIAEATGSKRSLPVDITVHVNGGNGDDRMFGGDEQDVFFSGPTGKDNMHGNKGDDALLSESRKWPGLASCTAAMQKNNPRCDEDKPHAGKYDDGKDEMWGGEGDDQFVVDYPCGHHEMHGGGGRDIAGFARSGRFDIKAQLGGAASHATPFHGRSFNPDLCAKEDGTTIDDDIEILEAADGNDELWGNDKENWIWGREGNDEIHGLGGNDHIKPGSGNDQVFE